MKNRQNSGRKLIEKVIVSNESLAAAFPSKKIITDEQQKSWAKTAQEAYAWCLENSGCSSSNALVELILWLFNPSVWPNSRGFVAFDNIRIKWAKALIEMHCAGFGPHKIYENALEDIEKIQTIYKKHVLKYNQC